MPLSQLVKRAINSCRFPSPVGSYIQVFQAGNMSFITGQLPVDPTTIVKVGDGDITLEARQVMENLMAVLGEAGLSAKDVVSAVVYLTDINSLDTVWQKYFTDPQPNPSRAVVEFSALVLGIQLEISAIVIKD